MNRDWILFLFQTLDPTVAASAQRLLRVGTSSACYPTVPLCKRCLLTRLLPLKRFLSVTVSVPERDCFAVKSGRTWTTVNPEGDELLTHPILGPQVPYGPTL